MLPKYKCYQKSKQNATQDPKQLRQAPINMQIIKHCRIKSTNPPSPDSLPLLDTLIPFLLDTLPLEDIPPRHLALDSQLLSNCSGSSWRSGAQAPYRSRLGWNAGAFRHVLSSHTGSSLLYLVWELRSHPFYLIKSLCNCTSAAPISSVPLVKRSTVISPALSN